MNESIPTLLTSWLAIAGEANPEVQTNHAEFRRACTISIWKIESLSSLKETAVRHKELSEDAKLEGSLHQK